MPLRYEYKLDAQREPKREQSVQTRIALRRLDLRNLFLRDTTSIGKSLLSEPFVPT